MRDALFERRGKKVMVDDALFERRGKKVLRISVRSIQRWRRAWQDAWRTRFVRSARWRCPG